MTPEQRAALATRLRQPDVAQRGDQQAADVLNQPGSGTGMAYQNVSSAVIKRELLIANAVTSGLAEGDRNLSAWALISQNARRAAGTALTLTNGVPLAASTPTAADRIVNHLVALVTWVETLPEIEATQKNVRDRFTAIFQALVDSGWISNGTRLDIVALAQRPRSYAEELGLAQPITAQDVGEAWKLGGGR